MLSTCNGERYPYHFESRRLLFGRRLLDSRWWRRGSIHLWRSRAVGHLPVCRNRQGAVRASRRRGDFRRHRCIGSVIRLIGTIGTDIFRSREIISLSREHARNDCWYRHSLLVLADMISPARSRDPISEANRDNTGTAVPRRPRIHISATPTPIVLCT